MSAKIVGAVTALIILSLAGLLVLQIMQLDSTMELKEQAFRRNVLASMGLVAQSLATRQLIDAAISGRAMPDSAIFNIGPIDHNLEIFRTQSPQDTVVAKEIVVINGDTVKGAPIWYEDGTIHYNVESPQRIQIHSYDISSGVESMVLDTFSQAGPHTYCVDSLLYPSGHYLWKYQSRDVSVVLDNNEERTFKSRLLPPPGDSGNYTMFMTVISSLIDFDSAPIEKRLSVPHLDSLISLGLADNGIDLDYAFGVRSLMTDSISLVKDDKFLPELRTTPYRARLFTRTAFTRPYELLLYFPDQQIFLLRETSPMLLLTILFVIIITACFAYIIRTILKQKRFSDHIIEFINNMTHEFKTPIATVRLACEALSRPDVYNDEGKIVRYNEMIQNENRRMSNQTEKILQMAVLEEGRYELQLTTVDAHEIITDIVESERLRVSSRKGTITLTLNAERTNIDVDEVHFTNIIGNLLDNAGKYSENAPEITVSTKNIEKDLLIIIEDKGKGISKADQKFVFDKYFRVSAGNVHDVKGFGLGLSYVKLMTEAMDGAVVLKSDLGRGTRVNLSFPLSKTGESAS
ncbi:MAG: HAMP domain-containing sensor histidine kinase [Candidatus Zixiibacteriota bacterium]